MLWELTNACNLTCVHCLTSSGRRDPRELDTLECQQVIDQLQRMRVRRVDIGGGEPTMRPDFWELLDYAVGHQVGVSFATNGVKISNRTARQLAAAEDIAIQISLDGATAEVNDAVRGHGSYAMALNAMRSLAQACFANVTISVVLTRHNIPQLDAFKRLADTYGARLRLTELRPAGRGADTWQQLHPTDDQQRGLPELLKGAARAAYRIDPVGDIYADNVLAGNVRNEGGLENAVNWAECSPCAQIPG